MGDVVVRLSREQLAVASARLSESAQAIEMLLGRCQEKLGHVPDAFAKWGRAAAVWRRVGTRMERSLGRKGNGGTVQFRLPRHEAQTVLENLTQGLHVANRTPRAERGANHFHTLTAFMAFSAACHPQIGRRASLNPIEVSRVYNRELARSPSRFRQNTPLRRTADELRVDERAVKRALAWLAATDRAYAALTAPERAPDLSAIFGISE